MKRRRHKKLYYAPGLISLVLVPLLFAYFGKQRYKELDKTVLEIDLYRPSLQDTLLRISYPADRTYEKVVLSADTEENKANLASVKQRLVEMVANNDSAGGIHISFDDAKYAAYVDAISLVYGMENVAKVVSDDGIRYFNVWRPKTNFLLCGGSIVEYYPLPEPSLLEKIEMLPDTILREFEFFSPALKELWLMLAILSLLMALSIGRCYRANKTST